MKKKILFVTNDPERLLSVMEAFAATGDYLVESAPAQSMMDALGLHHPNVLFLDASSACPTLDEFTRQFSLFHQSAHQKTVRLIVLNPSEDEPEILIGPQHLTLPHTFEKLAAAIDGSWGYATEQPFNLQLSYWGWPQGSYSTYYVKERRLKHIWCRSKGQASEERACDPTPGQWERILKVCDEMDVWSIPDDLDFHDSSSSPGFFVRVRTRRRWVDSTVYLIASRPEYKTRLNRLRSILESVMSCQPSGDEASAPSMGVPEGHHLPSAFLACYGAPMGGSYVVRLAVDDLCYSGGPGLNFHLPPQCRLTPSADQWRAFWQEAEAVDLWRWRRCYRLPPDVMICDGNSWEIAIRSWDARIILSSGENAYPADADPAETSTMGHSERFKRFTAAIRALVGGRRFG